MFKLDDCIAFLAGRVTKELIIIHDKELSAAGISRAQWMALYYIYNEGELTQKMLAKLLGSRESTVARLLDRMGKDGFVIRTKKDRRTNYIEITSKGEEAYKAGLEITRRFKERCLCGISDEDIDTFKRVLDMLALNARSE